MTFNWNGTLCLRVANIAHPFWQVALPVLGIYRRVDTATGTRGRRIAAQRVGPDTNGTFSVQGTRLVVTFRGKAFVDGTVVVVISGPIFAAARSCQTFRVWPHPCDALDFEVTETTLHRNVLRMTSHQ